MQAADYLVQTHWADWKFEETYGRIPKRLWQTYKTLRPPLDAMDAYWSWKEQNPDLPMFTHDDDLASNCIKHIYGTDMHAMYQAFPLPVMRADFWRYAILYAFGGIYADIDVQALKPIERWLPPIPDGQDWPPDGSLKPEAGWDDCSIVIGVEGKLHFCQWVSVRASFIAASDHHAAHVTSYNRSTIICAFPADDSKWARPSCVETNAGTYCEIF